LNAYAAAVRAYVQAFPAHPRTKDFGQLSRERPWWEQVVRWHALAGPYATRLFAMPPREAKLQADRCRAFLQGARPLIDGERVNDYRRCVEAIAQQDPAMPGSAAAKLRGQFAAAYVKDVWFIEMENDKVYYLGSDPEVDVEAARKKGKSGYTNINYL